MRSWFSRLVPTCVLVAVLSLIWSGVAVAAPPVSWFTTGNAGTSPSTNFLGTTDGVALVVRTNNLERLRVAAGGNVGIGTNSPTVPLDVKGDVNSSTKYDLGGTTVLQTPGDQNTFVGHAAGNPNTTGGGNTATGAHALQHNTTGGTNTASGDGALSGNTTGTANTADGKDALLSNSAGGGNTASGWSALAFNTTGSNNTAVGFLAGASPASNFANANTTGSNNTFIGYNAGSGTPTQLTNATAIGANAAVGESNAVVLGGTGADAVNVGIGTQTPQSSLQVVGNYIQFPTITGSAPPAADCSSATQAGRVVVRTDGATNLYICTGTGGWVGK